MLFYHEIIAIITSINQMLAFDLDQYKPGSKERGHCLDINAKSLSSIEEPCCMKQTYKQSTKFT